MGQTTNEVKWTAGPGGARAKKGGAAPVLIALGLTAAIMAGAYAGLCAWAGSRTVFYPRETVGGVDVGGLTVDQAAQVLAGVLPGKTIAVSPVQEPEKEGRGIRLYYPGGIGLHRRTMSRHCPAAV